MPNLHKKSVSIEIKSDASDDRSFIAYASIFGNVDSHRDVILKGAYAKSLAGNRKVRMLFNHNVNEVIGRFTEIKEDEIGLHVKGRFSDTPRGNEIRQLVLDGAIDSLSIGYQTKDYEYNDAGHRLIKEVDLFEISLVVFPSNESAQIISAKSHDEIIESLTNRIKLLKA